MLSFDIANFPTAETVKMLARLLDQMTKANDRLKAAASQTLTTSTNTAPQPTAGAPPPPLTQPADHGQTTSTAEPGSVGGQTSTLWSQPLSVPNATHPPEQPQQPPAPPVTAFTRFHARSIPTIDIYSYLARILKYCPCANECFLSLLVYFDRMSRNSNAISHSSVQHEAAGDKLPWQKKPVGVFAIDSYNVHRLLISGIMVASKYFSDVFFTNTRYAKVGGLPVAEINVLEVEFLRLNNFGISIAVEELQQYGDLLFRHSCTDPIVRQSLIDARLIPPSAAGEDFGPPNSLPLYATSEREHRERGRSGGEGGDGSSALPKQDAQGYGHLGKRR